MLTTLFQYTSQIAITTIEWTELMRRIRNGYWRDIVDHCRKEAIGNDELKRRLPAFGASVTFLDGDEAANVVKYNHVVAIDFNKVLSADGDLLTKISECREICRGIPSVVGFYVTKGGRGFRVFVNVSTGIADHKRIYHPLQEYFEAKLHMQANDRYKDLTQLSFVSYDPDCFYRTIEDAPEFDIETIFPNKVDKMSPMRMNSKAKMVIEHLFDKYEIRFNVMERMLQCRVRQNIVHVDSQLGEWHNVDERLVDMIVRDLNESCAPVTYNQFQWMMDNNHVIMDYNAVDDYDYHLPEWDGRDYISLMARGLNTAGSAFADCLHTWLVAMYRAWFGGKPNNRVIVLYSAASETGKTDWALNLLPKELARYQTVSAIDFMQDDYDNKPLSLLVVVEDFIGNDWVAIDRIRTRNPKASILVTAHCRLKDVPQYVSQFEVNKKKDGDISASIPAEYLYSQLKHISSL